MPKLLQINSVINSGSTGRIAENIGGLAAEHGWQSYIAYGRDDRPSVSNKIKIGTKWDLIYHGMQTRLFDNHGFASKKATKTLVDQIRKIQPDIIHLHNIHGYYINVEILFTFLASSAIPVVWTLHDCWAFTGHCSHYMAVNCNKWQTQCFNCPLHSAYPKSYTDHSKKNYIKKKALFTSLDSLTLVTPSQWLKDQVAESFLNIYPAKVINNGIDLNIFKKRDIQQLKTKYRIPAGVFIMLGVASGWDDRKGLSDFIKLSHQLSKNEMLIMVGLTRTQLKELPSNIVGLTRTDSIEELSGLYSLADVYLNLTYEDNFPTTNLESLACGTPVITYNTGGSPETLTEETGYVVEKGNLGSLRNIINIIKNSTDNRSAVCRNRAETFYNKNEKNKEYLDLYQKLTGL
ncbi:glycosyltransferase [Niabella sp. CC-SYL272]|uniref:glycosyltransferase n=1 Tax=Niabella agricola TaxID=2891571 RepID=UPI001F2A1D43|nr:glycosyltransferase [Niabella agricola]MCF3107517.1 glycosyltransferase [Niabella agricola]